MSTHSYHRHMMRIPHTGIHPVHSTRSPQEAAKRSSRNAKHRMVLSKLMGSCSTMLAMVSSVPNGAQMCQNVLWLRPLSDMVQPKLRKALRPDTVAPGHQNACYLPKKLKNHLIQPVPGILLYYCGNYPPNESK